MSKTAKPEIPMELWLMRTVISQPEESDKKSNVELAFYRNLLKEKPTYFVTKKSSLEKEYREECRAWARDAKADKRISADPKSADVGAEKCLEMLGKLITDLTK